MGRSIPLVLVAAAAAALGRHRLVALLTATTGTWVGTPEPVAAPAGDRPRP